MNLNSKKVLLIGWGCNNKKDTHAHQVYYLTIKKIFPKLVSFDSKKKYFQLGKDKMNQKLLSYLKKKEFDFIIFLMDEDEFYPETIFQARKLQPKSKTLFIISDDDLRFDNYSRYYALLFDHTLTSQFYLKEYYKDGIRSVSFNFDYNTYKLKPFGLKKKYDVVFIGRPKADRAEIMKYLIDNRINVKIFGWEWHKYPELKVYYKGPLDSEDYAKITNQTKINLCLTKAGLVEEKKDLNITGKKTGRINGRFFEIMLCKSFQIAQYFPEAPKLFRENKETVLFKTKQELLEKIKYYLKHEKERERIAENAYKRLLKDYNREKQLRSILNKVFRKKRKEIQILKSTKKLTLVRKEDLNDVNKLNQKLKSTDYVYFSHKDPKNSIYKNNFQVYSLEKTGKPISCCEYYVFSKHLGNYLRLRTYYAFKRIGKEANRLININQLMTEKKFFLKNLDSFKKLFNNQQVYLLNEKNTAFVSIPLITIEKINPIKYSLMEKSFDMIFIANLFSLLHQKKILSVYPYKLILNSLSGQSFILKHLFRLTFNKNNWNKLILNKSHV